MTKNSRIGILLTSVPLVVIITVSLTFCLTACKKKPTAPVVTTAIVSQITQTSASSGGNVTSDGGAEVTSKGVCWNIAENPTTSDNKTVDGAGTGAFTSNLTLLTPGTKYYIRSYSTNEAGTGYGKQLSFNTTAVMLATVSTADVTSITETTAVSGGDVTSDGGGTVNARGVCWSSTSQNPTIDDDNTTDGSGTGSFTSDLSGLSPGTDYYVRAYATNSAGTSYGSTISFPTAQSGGTGIIFNPGLTYGTVTDIDGNTYKTIEIGSKKGASGLDGTGDIKAAQVWMAENLRSTKYNDGTDIPLVTGNSEWTSLGSPAYCWYDNDAVSNKETYGALYNWYAVGTGKLCPDGWHIPTDNEWKTLTTSSGWESTTGGKMMETGTLHWVTTSAEITNEYGFTALPGGYRHDELGTFDYRGYKGYFWSSTEASSISAWHREFTTAAIYILRYNYGMKTGFSVRCIKD
jgi:uncharacterized protein (TIGR02145 family)